jgi:hypothetical protein
MKRPLRKSLQETWLCACFYLVVQTVPVHTSNLLGVAARTISVVSCGFTTCYRCKVAWLEASTCRLTSSGNVQHGFRSVTFLAKGAFTFDCAEWLSFLTHGKLAHPLEGDHELAFSAEPKRCARALVPADFPFSHSHPHVRMFAFDCSG